MNVEDNDIVKSFKTNTVKANPLKVRLQFLCSAVMTNRNWAVSE